jgi:hypothetical protein
MAKRQINQKFEMTPGRYFYNLPNNQINLGQELFS